MFTPVVYLFLSIYLLLFIMLFYVDSFFYGWMLMEFTLFLFVGMSYCLMTYNFSFIIMYFLLQAISSICMLVFYVLSSAVLLTFFILLKLSLFPFLFWYYTVVYPLPNFVFFMTATFQKFPIFYLLKVFNVVIITELFFLSLLISILWVGSLMILLSDFRMIIVSSSIAGNLWLFLSLFSNLPLMFIFFSVYSLSLFMILKHLGMMIKPTRTTNYNFLFMMLANISGMPPFPLFWLKCLLILSSSFYSNFLLFISLIFYSLVMFGYLQLSLNYLVNQYTNQLIILL